MEGIWSNMLLMHFEIFKCSHKKLWLSNCGLFLDGEQPFIGASPDGIVGCACHDQALKLSVLF